MLLVLFHAEELKRDVLDSIHSTDRLGKAVGSRSVERVPGGVKKPVEKALAALVADKAITLAEKREIEELIDYRNAIGHQVHTLLADIASKGSVREMADGLAQIMKIPKYRPDAVDRVRQLRSRINGLPRTHHYVRTLSYTGLIFELAERVFLADIERLRAKVRALSKARLVEVEKLNMELSLEGTGLEGWWHPAGPWSKYDNGRLSPIGVEICYRLFDMGRSPLAVAHLANLSLIAARNRKKAWSAAGGRRRPKVDLAELPRPKLRRRYDD